MKKYSERHGGPYDRGSADSYYGRPRRPHYYVGNSYQSMQVSRCDMLDDEIEAYNAGYDDNERDGYKKSW